MILKDKRTVELIKTWQEFCITFKELQKLWEKVNELADQELVERIPDNQIQKVLSLVPYSMKFRLGVPKFIRQLSLVGGLETFIIGKEVSLKEKKKEKKDG